MDLQIFCSIAKHKNHTIRHRPEEVQGKIFGFMSYENGNWEFKHKKRALIPGNILYYRPVFNLFDGQYYFVQNFSYIRPITKKDFKENIKKLE